MHEIKLQSASARRYTHTANVTISIPTKLRHIYRLRVEASIVYVRK